MPQLFSQPNVPKSAMRILFSALLTALLVGQACAVELTGRVVAVADGDTLTLLVNRQQVRVRLAEIDAPERKQPFGNRSRQSLHELCHGKAAIVATDGKQHRDRMIGTVYCDGIDANAEQVRRGMAWVYVRYALQASPLYVLQDQARSARAGLWADPQPIPPWQFRLHRK